MRARILTVLILIAVAAPASAQTVVGDACTTATGPFTVTSAKPFTVTWVQDAKVPASPTDPTLVDERINGFTYSLDGAAPVDFTPQSGAACAAGTSQAGRIPYLFVMPSGMAKGAHTISITAWNFVLNADGTPTTTRQLGVPTSVPFVGIDPMKTGPPLSPKNGKIWK